MGHGENPVSCTYVCLVAQLCPIFFSPKDCSLPVSSAHEIFQARILEWVAVCYSMGSSQPRDGEPMSPALAGAFFTTSTTWEVPSIFWESNFS